MRGLSRTTRLRRGSGKPPVGCPKLPWRYSTTLHSRWISGVQALMEAWVTRCCIYCIIILGPRRVPQHSARCCIAQGPGSSKAQSSYTCSGFMFQVK